MADTIRRVALVGAGVIGAGWAARCLARGLDVVATDPGDDAGDKLRAAVDNAWPALSRVGLAAGSSRDRLRFVAEVEGAVAGADFIQESAPENEDLKRRLLASIQADCRHPERVVIGHPFNPVYLLPLVEVLGGEHTAPASIGGAVAFYRTLGMRPLKVRAEIPGYISDRLQEALWREALHMVAEGVATTEEIDDAVRFGPGLRWSFMGTCLIFHMAGGDQGMRHMLEQFGPALKLPWTKLEAPELSRALIDRMVEGTAAQAKGRSVKELERFRDDCLIGIMEAIAAAKARAGIAPDE
jgi:carnitine 3-dehydrogenase